MALMQKPRAAFVALILVVGMLAAPASAATDGAKVIHDWYRLILELVRHTATYTPPVASRAFAYTGIIAHEAIASGDPAAVSLAGQLHDMPRVPAREAGADYDEEVVLHAALTVAVNTLFSNTGPTGQRAKAAMEKALTVGVTEGVAPDVVDRSTAYGQAVAGHVLAWAESDGGAKVENMGFPMEYTPEDNPAAWVPTSLVRQQQAPLLPYWGTNRPFAMPAGDTCNLPPPPEYSEAPDSAFYAEAMEVYETSKSLTDEQKIIARFWSDDPMLSPTPPGHWINIAMIVLEGEQAPAAQRAEVLAKLGIALGDAFIGNWYTKYDYNLLRPITYIRRVIDPDWQVLLITPPFPEYPSGHSTQSGAAAHVLTALFGENYAFTDNTHEADGLAPRPFASFAEAAEEAGISRLYGGIHFRAAIDLGLDQGECIGAYAAQLVTRK